ITVAYGYFTFVVCVDPAITRAQRILRLGMIWLIPVVGLFLVSRLYAGDPVDSRDNLGRGNPYQ
ncbi:MAG: hypothetical protein ACXWSD_18045, partial [Bdellovibrionota bacterium]